jgi:ribonuclease Z
MVAETFSFADGEDSAVVLEEEGLKVTAFLVDHAPIRPAVGYRFDYRGRSAVISGDTVPAPALVRVAQGADLLLHDALSPRLLKLVEDAAGAAGQQMRRRILADVPDYHATAPQAADAAREARVGALAITHIVPPLPLKGLEEIFLADAREHFGGELWRAADGDLYSLRAGATPVERSRLISRLPGL